jgi:hypothetical protein
MGLWRVYYWVCSCDFLMGFQWDMMEYNGVLWDLMVNNGLINGLYTIGF